MTVSLSAETGGVARTDGGTGCDKIVAPFLQFKEDFKQSFGRHAFARTKVGGVVIRHRFIVKPKCLAINPSVSASEMSKGGFRGQVNQQQWRVAEELRIGGPQAQARGADRREQQYDACHWQQRFDAFPCLPAKATSRPGELRGRAAAEDKTLCPNLQRDRAFFRERAFPIGGTEKDRRKGIAPAGGRFEWMAYPLASTIAVLSAASRRPLILGPTFPRSSPCLATTHLRSVIVVGENERLKIENRQ